MSYANAMALQAAVYQALVSDETLNEMVSGAIYDSMPDGAVPDLYVSLGSETVLDRSDSTGSGALHRFDISVVAVTSGFAMAKQVAARISTALQTGLSLSQGVLVYLNFERAAARRSGPSGALRQIDLRFRARVDDD